MGKLLSTILSFLVSTAVIKGIMLISFYYLIMAVVPYLLKLIPNSIDIEEYYSSLPDSVRYYLDYFCVPFGIKAILSSLATRFTIRRLPFLG